MKTKLIAVMSFLSLLSSSVEAATVVSNLENATAGNLAVGAQPHVPEFPGPFIDYFSRAQSFTTGTNLLQLGQIVLEMEASPGGGVFHVDLHADAAGYPSETRLMALAGSDNPTTTGLFSYVPTAELTLLPGATYWVVMSTEVIPPNRNAEYRLHATQDTTELGELGWSIGNASFSREIVANVDFGWQGPNSLPLKMSVSAVPEPSCIVLSLATVAIGRRLTHVRRRHV